MEKDRLLGDACRQIMKILRCHPGERRGPGLDSGFRRNDGILLLAFFLFSGCTTMRTLAPPVDTLTAKEHLTLAQAYLAKGEKPLAIRQYHAALDQDSQSVQAWLGLGNLAFEDKDYKNAEAYFRG